MKKVSFHPSVVTNYSWVSFGDKNDPAIAFIAPSSGFGGEEAQNQIQQRIDLLVDKGFYVKVPRYENGSLMLEPEVPNQKNSDRLGTTISPATSDETGASQIIYCILSGLNMLPLMGGDSFENKIPLIVKYFEEHPEQKNPQVKIFGMSNSTYATILAGHGICSFISSPFVNVFNRAKSDPKHFLRPAQELEKLLKNQETETYSRRIISSPINKLDNITHTFHYPLNFGNIAKKEHVELLQIPENQTWSFSIEGFLQIPRKQLIAGYGGCLYDFLQHHQNNPPAFIEIGNIATRLDGRDGYENLFHDEETGEIAIGEDIESDYNVNKVYANKSKLAKDLGALFAEKTNLESAINESEPKKQRWMNRQIRLLSLMPNEIFQKINNSNQTLEPQGLDKEDIATILRSQNLVLQEVANEIKEVANHFQIPLIQNPRNGHCANMSVVNGGNNSIKLEGEKLLMLMQPISRGIQPKSVAPFESIESKERS